MNIFDIFISFRGEDVRNNLIGHLYNTLCYYGLVTIFLDEKELLIGDPLVEKLEKTIEESRTAIVILSKDYASSKWCLRELVKIIKCMDDATNRILPVFYHVDPSDVRNQSGTFKESFDVYEKIIALQLDSNQEKKYSKGEVKQWREALTRVGHLSGVVVKKDSPEVEGVNKITNQIFDMLRKPKLVAPHRLKNLVDMPSRLSDINNLLDFESNEVRFIGIVGMGGIGKTTIAQLCYDNIASKFDNDCCFLTIRSSDNLTSLQLQLLSRLLRKLDIKISQESEGANLIKDCLSRRKVLIVLDGVNEKSQLQNLAGNFDWFGPKSRIIITTRNKDIFSHPDHQKVQVYNVKPLDYNPSLSLFCKHAFGGGRNNSDGSFKNLSEKIVEKIEGHPQALEEIGSFLYEKDIEVWTEELDSLVLVENKRLFNTLKISFDKLEPRSQQAFLDVSCFFNGKSKGKVIEILESLGYRPHSVLQLLGDRYLIEIKNGDIIYIPNLIQAMGRQIEREAPQRSRIWLRKDAFDIFDEQHGVKYIKAVVLDNREKQPELVLKPNQFKDMTSLRILDIDNVNLFPRNLEYLSNQLRLFNWHGYPSHSLPRNFEAPYLFELLLPLAQTTHLWNGLKRFEKLKVIDASDSHNLVETPNLSLVPNLERLVLSNCIRLHTIDNSIISLNHLVLLDFTFCIRLKTFTLMGSLRSHITLKLSGSGLQYPNTSSQVARQPQSRTLSYRVRRILKRFVILKRPRQ